MIISKLAILFSDMPDEINRVKLEANGYQVININDTNQIQAYEKFRREESMKKMKFIEEKK